MHITHAGKECVCFFFFVPVSLEQGLVLVGIFRSFGLEYIVGKISVVYLF